MKNTLTVFNNINYHRFLAMLKFRLREILLKQDRNVGTFYRLMSGSSSDEEKTTKTKKDAKQKPSGNQALNRLNTLLQQMIQDDVVAKQTKPLELARPKPKKFKDLENRKESDVTTETSDEKKLATAVKDVAKIIGGNAAQTESELLQKLLKTTREQTQDAASTNLSDIIKDMKIDRESKASEVSRAQQVRQLLNKAQKPLFPKEKLPLRKRVPKFQESLNMEKVNLFGSEPLGIFTSKEQIEVTNKTWDKLYRRELRLATIQPPSNYFQQMILWTEQGKVWKFPIDNEQDLEERNVPFTEHIFLEKHLDWCPPKGPIRHFMELVCVGLSKNPYLSVDEKKEHIEWFKNYFAEKEKLLKDVDAIPRQFEFNPDRTKIEA